MEDYEAFRATTEDPEDELTEEVEDTTTGFHLSIKIGASLKIRESAEELDLEGLGRSELEALLAELQQKLDDLQDEEPEDDDSDEYDDWEDAVDDLEDYISQVEDAIEELSDE